MSGKKVLYSTLVLCSLILAVYAVNILWVIDNGPIAGEDVPNHLLFSLEFYYEAESIIESGGTSFFNKLVRLIQIISAPLNHNDGKYSNFMYFLTMPFYYVFGKSILSARLSNLMYILLLAGSAYQLGILVHSRFTALLSVFIVLMNPFIFESMRQYGLDLPLTAFTSCSILLLIKSNYFRAPVYSMLLGICTGLGMLFKPAIALYIFPSIFYVIFRIFFYSPDKSKLLPEYDSSVKYLNIVLFLILTFLIWHLGIPKAGNYTAYIRPIENKIVYFWGFVKSIVFTSIGWPLFILMIPGTVFIHKARNEYRHIIFLWLFLPLFAFALSFLFLWYSPRFFMPVIPAGALIIAYAMESINNGRIRFFALSVVLIFLFSQFFALTFAYGIPERTYREEYSVEMSEAPIRMFNGSSYGEKKYDFAQYKIDEITALITSGRKLSKKVVILTVLLTPGDPRPFELRYRTKNTDRNIDLIDFWSMNKSALAQMDEVEYIIFRVPEGSVISDWPPQHEFIKFMRTVPHHIADFLLLKKESARILPDFVKKFYDYRPNFEFVSSIDTDLGFKWLVFSKKI